MRQAAERLAATGDTEAAWAEAERELNWLQGFLQAATTSEEPAVQAAQVRFQEALQAHAMGWLTLAAACQENDPTRVDEILGWAGEGDRLLEDVDEAIEDLHQEFSPLA
ncbi:MAG: hypothetical protein ACYCW6_16960 [Candidatus Xenobia bacterium]